MAFEPVVLELAAALVFICVFFGLGIRHWRTMSPAKAVARIFGWYLIVMGTAALLLAFLDVPVPGRVIASYVVEIVLGYCMKMIAGSPWPLPRRPRSASVLSGASPRD